MCINTACSSSLVAVEHAHKAVASKVVYAALVGGVNALLLSSTTLSIWSLGALSPSARCRTFDVMADGYGRGEAFGTFLLSRTSECSSCPTVVLESSSVNQDGRSSSLTAPHGPSQASLLYDAMQATSAELNYISSHGTGKYSTAK